MSEPVHADAHDLASFGYKQELSRSLGSFSSFAAGFSYISILTGMFQTSSLGFLFAGRAFIWAWPVVFFGQMTVALQFAELSAHYPAGRLGVPVVEEAGRQVVGLEHGLDLPLCADRDRARGGAGLAGDPAADLPQFQIVELPTGAAADLSKNCFFQDPAFAKNAFILGAILIVLTTTVNLHGRAHHLAHQQHRRARRARSAPPA